MDGQNGKFHPFHGRHLIKMNRSNHGFIMFEIKHSYELYISTKLAGMDLAYMISTINRHLIQKNLYSNVYIEMKSMLNPEYKPEVKSQIVRKK